jgi:hypothetical protein
MRTSPPGVHAPDLLDPGSCEFVRPPDAPRTVNHIADSSQIGRRDVSKVRGNFAEIAGAQRRPSLSAKADVDSGKIQAIVETERGAGSLLSDFRPIPVSSPCGTQMRVRQIPPP